MLGVFDMTSPYRNSALLWSPVNPALADPLQSETASAQGRGVKLRPSNSGKLRLAKLRAKRGGAAAHNRIWNLANREKHLAHKAVEYAVKTGKLVRQPCECCGVTEKVHAHHDDYSKRLEVNWLCPLHHKQRHAELALGSSEQGLPRLRSRMDHVRHPVFLHGRCR